MQKIFAVTAICLFLAACGPAPTANPPKASPVPGASSTPGASSSPRPSTSPTAGQPAGGTSADPGLKLSYGFDTPPTGLETIDTLNGRYYALSLTADRFGKAGSAYHFSPSSSYFKFDFDINPDVLPQLTMSVWTRFAAGSNPQDGTFTVLSHLDGDYDRSLAIDPRGGGRGWSAYAGSAQVLGFETVEPGHWVMLTAVYDQAAKTAALYVNDKLVKQSDKAILGMGRKFLMVGQLPGNGDGYDGDVDELRIYNRPFSLADVQALFKATKP